MTDARYDNDFYAWTQVQAAALRQREAGTNALDWDRLAEEIEDMGRSEVNAVASTLVRIVEHLHKLRSSSRAEPKRVWRAEIRAWRQYAKRRLTPAVRVKMDETLDALHSESVAFAEAAFAVHEPEHTPLDPDVRWTLAQLLGERDDPLESL